MLLSVMLFPQPDAPSMPIRLDVLRKLISRLKVFSFLWISTDIATAYHLPIFFIFLPEIRFIRKMTTNAMTITTATQIPAVR